MKEIPISQLMKRPVQAVHIDDSMAAVQDIMNATSLAWVPVKDDAGQVLGAISATDLLHFHAQGRDAQTVKAWQWCHYKPLSVTPQTAVSAVARQMRQNRVHHAVVVDEGGLHGVVSTHDLLALIADPPAAD
jgi:CBS domain-containing protein